jgi:hypothetical protein
MTKGQNDGEFFPHPSMPVNNSRNFFINNHFGGTSPFKVQVNFDILVFEGQIDVDALEKWLNLLEGYFSCSQFF